MKNPEALGVVGPWILNRDSENYAIQNFEACAKHPTQESPFKEYKRTSWARVHAMEDFGITRRGEKMSAKRYREGMR